MGLNYKDVMIGLLPPGPAWTGEQLKSLLEGLSVEFGRYESKLYQIIEEADPRTTTELIEEWEAFAGIGDPTQSLATRRDIVASKIISRGGLSKRYLIALAYTAGYTIEISEVKTARVGMFAGESVWGLGGDSTFFVSVISGDMSTSGLNRLVEVIKKAKPPYTVAIFEFLDTRARVGVARVGDRFFKLL